jgi:hypothetical protein
MTETNHFPSLSCCAEQEVTTHQFISLCAVQSKAQQHTNSFLWWCCSQQNTINPLFVMPSAEQSSQFLSLWCCAEQEQPRGPGGA